jgi:pimeloyl-ACP methyl ester carboxylesterase
VRLNPTNLSVDDFLASPPSATWFDCLPKSENAHRGHQLLPALLAMTRAALTTRCRASGRAHYNYFRDYDPAGPVLFAGILPDYVPMPVLRKLRTPQLWILGADDIDAPPIETWRRLLALHRSGMPISAVMFAGAEHGLYQYELNAKGERDSLRLLVAYFPLMRDFIVSGSIERQY